jgi:voltage-gated potassium channel Kch
MNDISEIKRNLYVSVALVLIIYVVGTFFYHNLEGWSYLDSVYFITMTITTIGYGDVVPKTELGKIFSIFLAVIGISVGFFLIYSIAALREKTFDKEVLGKLMLLRNITGIRGKKKPAFLQSLKSKIGEV